MDLKALRKISYGMYIITSKNGEKINGQISNTFFQITSDHPTVAVSINQENFTHSFIEKSGVFGVSVLSKNVPLNVIGNFGFKSGREIDKFQNIPYEKGEITGSPIVKNNSIAFFEVEVIDSVDMGTHTIFIGRIVNAGNLGGDEPMTYSYYQIKGGKSPKTAPTYIKEEPEKKEVTKKMYRCKACGYVYDPELGDPDGGIDPGTAFEDIPDDWVCPVCGVGKDMFEEQD